MGEPAAPTRVVLLGASNLTRGFSTVVDLAGERLGGPLEIHSALGHGRSYGLEASFLFRALPGIDGCGLWAALGAAGGPVHALVTDVGNDVAYGVAPGTLGGWVARVLDRLEGLGARPVLTGLPLFKLEALDPFWFGFWSRVLFPGRGLEHGPTLDVARAVQGRLEEEAERRGLALINPRPEWYGFDPIHYARHLRREVWGEVLGAWLDAGGGRGAPDVPSGRLRLTPPPAAAYKRFGRPRNRKQPSARLADGSTVSMY